MARIRNGILGGFSNKVGEVIGQNYAGVSTMRAMPKYVTNPKTPAQEAHRRLVASCGSFFSVFAGGLRWSIANKNGVENGFNASFRKNFDKFSLDANGNVVIDVDKLDLGEYYGEPLYGVSVDNAHLSAGDNFFTLNLIWDASVSGGLAMPKDRLILYVANQLSKSNIEPLYGSIVDAKREDGSASVIIPITPNVGVGSTILVGAGVTTYEDSGQGGSGGGGSNPWGPRGKPSETIKIHSKNRISFTLEGVIS